MRDIIGFVVDATLWTQLAFVKRRVYEKVGRLSAEYFTTKEPLTFEEKDAEQLKKISKNGVWSRHNFDCGWFKFTGKIPENAKGKHVGFLIAITGEGCQVDENGTPLCGISLVNGTTDLLQPSVGKRFLDFDKRVDGGEAVDFWLDAANNFKYKPDMQTTARLIKADIVSVRDDVRGLYYDMLALGMQKHTDECRADKAKRTSIKSAIKRALKAALGFSPESVAKARAILAEEMKNGKESDRVFYAVGHAHLDLAWLWPIRETKRKAGRTFANQLTNMERYPGYVFGASQPQQFAWMEEKYPELFAKLKVAAEKGTLDLQGGMWVECDTNLPCGESLIRQNLYGKRYWKEKFGVDNMNYCWLPDVFGFSGNLPQILKKCGMDYFLTIKLSWNEHNKFPKRSFVWEGIDDSDVLVHMPPEENYNGTMTPLGISRALRNYPEKDLTKTAAILYGVGDGGGGPSEGHVELAIREQNMNGIPKIILSKAQPFFEELAKDKDKFSRYKGELYLEKHQGTYTSQAKNKRFNRKIEWQLHNTEFLCTLATLKGAAYPKAKLEEIWKEVLLYQFHDIIPGSSIARVYAESTARYAKMLDELTDIQNTALGYLNGDNATEQTVAINTTGYARKELIATDDGTFTAELPPYGAAILSPYRDSNAMQATVDTLESDIYKLTFNKQGNISSLIDKRDGKEYAGDYLNKLNVYHDKKLFYNAWDIDWKYMNKDSWEFKPISVRYHAEDGFAIRETIYKFNRSTISQNVVLSEGAERIDFKTNVDWQETHKMLRAEFRPSVFSDEVTCDIQMGNIKRTTKNVTPVEVAQFEICAHKWVDVSDKERGISVLSESKYGWRVKEGLISMNLLRSPMYPAKNADKGAQTFVYSLYPHNGTLNEADTAREAYSLNDAPIIVKHGLPFDSFISVNTKHVVVETAKLAEDGSGIIVRLYEDAGEGCEAKLHVNASVASAEECDMLENPIKSADLNALYFGKFEIKTLLIKLL